MREDRVNRTSVEDLADLDMPLDQRGIHLAPQAMTASDPLPFAVE
jgi:hypothetical protein